MVERLVKGIKEVKRCRTLWSKETSQGLSFRLFFQIIRLLKDQKV